MSSKVVQVLVLLFVVCATGWAHARIPNQTRTEFGQDFVPAPEVIDAVSFGFDALIADYYWLQAVQVAGATDVVDADTAAHLGRLVDVVTTLNPHVDHPYRFAAVWLTHSRDQVVEANDLLERAIEYHPEDWRNYFYLGFNHFFYLGDFAAAATALETGMSLPGAPAYLPRLVARLKSHQGDIDVASVFLRQLLETSKDEAQTAKIEAALDEIEIEYKARHLDRARELFRKRNGRDIEHVDELVGPPLGVLRELPSPEPDSIPSALARGSKWIIDERDGRIISSYLGARYELHLAGMDQAVFADEERGEDGNQVGSSGEDGPGEG